MLQNLVFLHGQGNYMGRNFCAVVEGPETAAGHTVDVKVPVCEHTRTRTRRLEFIGMG
jgi:hypothetical protein